MATFTKSNPPGAAAHATATPASALRAKKKLLQWFIVMPELASGFAGLGLPARFPCGLKHDWAALELPGRFQRGLEWPCTMSRGVPVTVMGVAVTGSNVIFRC